MLRMFLNSLFVCFLSVAYAQGPYAARAGLAGSTAIHKDSSIILAWANKCILQRGLQHIADSSLGYATIGNSISPTGKAGENGIVSLGDGGVAILEFPQPIKDGIGYDFAVFENSFVPTFLELAFVEVSSDGINFFRFPSHSLTDTANPIGGFGSIEASNINNLAGKYVVNYGTPFDLSELPNTSLLDKQQITHVKIIDVVGTINPQYASYDTASRAIQDPYPTPYPSSGFDLDAIGVIHIATTGLEEQQSFIKQVYPNPSNDVLNIQLVENEYRGAYFEVVNSFGVSVLSGSFTNQLDISMLQQGMYYLRITFKGEQSTIKIIKN